MSENMWSRRRAAVQAETDAEEARAAEAAVAQKQAELEEKSDAEILAELDLEDPDEMKAGDDFAKFMDKAVPQRLRNRALRKLWLSDPMLANIDGLVDYGENFTDSATVIDNLKTSYQVGRGLLKHLEAKEEEQAAEVAAQDDDESPDTAVSDTIDHTEEETMTAEAEEHDDQMKSEPKHDTAKPAEATSVGQRMRFEFAS